MRTKSKNCPQPETAQKNGGVFERFLTANASARFLCRQIGMTDLANELVPVFWELQAAHERLVVRKANLVLIQIVKGIRAGIASMEQVEESFEMDGAALEELLTYLAAPPKQDLARHHSSDRRRAEQASGGEEVNPRKRIKRVSMGELSKKTAEVVRSVAPHREILVTERGRIIAKIVYQDGSTGVPYFARRKPSTEFTKLDKSGKTGHGVDATRSISQDREERLT